MKDLWLLLLLLFLILPIEAFFTLREARSHEDNKRQGRRRPLQCYVCDDCDDRDLRAHHITSCPPDQSQSCMKSTAKFAQYTTVSRSCSGAPAFDPRTCLDRTINIMRSKICLCDRQLCNGPSRELLNQGGMGGGNFISIIQDDLLSPPHTTSKASPFNQIHTMTLINIVILKFVLWYHHY